MTGTLALDVLLATNLLLSFAGCVLHLVYFFRCKTTYRWMSAMSAGVCLYVWIIYVYELVMWNIPGIAFLRPGTTLMLAIIVSMGITDVMERSRCK